MAQFPSKEIAQLSYEYRTLGLGYANIGGLLMSSGIGYDSDAARAIGGALTAIMTGVSYATSAEMAKRARPLPRLQEEPRAHAARDPQPPPRRPRRADRLREGSRPRRCRSTTPASPPRTQGYAALSAHAKARLGQRAEARRGARLPQRAGHRDRADRHHRPRDGLRHHRHRARLRAGEVQEARRRRLLQDHQPRGARGAARARLQRERRSARSRPTRSATARSARRPASTTPR